MAAGTVWAPDVWDDAVWADGVWADQHVLEERTVAGNEGGETSAFNDETDIWHPIEGSEGGEEGDVEASASSPAQAFPVVAGAEGGESGDLPAGATSVPTILDGNEGGETATFEGVSAPAEYVVALDASEGGESARFLRFGANQSQALSLVLRRRRR